jgi:hypothetical protein
MAKSATAAEKKRLKLSVLGYTKPFDFPKYWLWTKCCHPNYFFERMAWIGFAVIGCGSNPYSDEGEVAAGRRGAPHDGRGCWAPRCLVPC